MRTARIAIVPLLAISLAACGKSAGDAAPGAGDPDSPVSTIVDPGAQQRVEPTPQPVQPEPGTVDPHPVAWDGVDVGDDDRTLTFTFVGGVDTCYALGHVEVDYGTEAVTLTLYEGGRASRTFSLARPVVTLGRLPDCDVVVSDAGASRQHARISQANGEFVLTDLGSTNGTLVNDEAVRERVLADGDRITIGEAVLEFRRG